MYKLLITINSCMIDLMSLIFVYRNTDVYNELLLRFSNQSKIFNEYCIIKKTIFFYPNMNKTK